MRWPLCIQVHLAVVLWASVCIEGKRHEDYRVDVAKLAAFTQGTELVLLENALHTRQSYKLEDFFWTGSGDESTDDEPETWTSASTVYSTQTIVSTIYITPTSYINQTNSTSTPCIINCDPVTPQGPIDPTPTFPSSDSDEDLDADRQFWLLTVLKSDGKDPDIADLKNSLRNLYKKAFLRQQAKHLGIKPKTKRETKPEKPINVYIHKIDKLPNNGDEKIEVIYHVSVAGQPVDAATAAEDMRLVTDDEVKSELGYPFLVKAERRETIPKIQDAYIKPATPQELASSKPTWIVLAVSIVIIIVLLVMIAFLTVCVTKRQESRGVDNRQRVFNENQNGHENGAFQGDAPTEKGYKSGRRNQNPSPTYINFRSQPSNQSLMSPAGGTQSRPDSRISSGSSSSSFDISPLMGLGKQRTAKKPIRPRAAINKTTPLGMHKRNSLAVIDTDSSSLAPSPDTIFIGNYDPGVVSPKSYLSMPSIKSFPRSNNPEPLNKVLEPVSVLHLDMADDITYDQQPRDIDYRMFARHGSVGATEDPGVIGPVVWNIHRHRLQHGVSVDEGMDEMKIGSNVTKMRKRFHDLLDDTFSLFGSRRDSPVADSTITAIEVKSHSAIERVNEFETIKVRPKTSDPKRMGQQTSGEPRKGAWTSAAPSPLVRPISAPYMRPNTAPRIDMEQVLADGSLRQNDPAIPLIAAIKNEIGKCSLPGSTTNIHE